MSSSLQFLGVNLSAVATISDNNKHITRQLIFGDGQHKLIGCVLGDQQSLTVPLLSDKKSAVRFEITQGGGYVSIDGETPAYYREGQSFLANAGANIHLIAEEVVQYVRHLEG